MKDNRYIYILIFILSILVSNIFKPYYGVLVLLIGTIYSTWSHNEFIKNIYMIIGYGILFYCLFSGIK